MSPAKAKNALLCLQTHHEMDMDMTHSFIHRPSLPGLGKFARTLALAFLVLVPGVAWRGTGASPGPRTSGNFSSHQPTLTLM